MWWGDRDGRWEPLPKIGKDGDLAIRNALDWTKDNQDIIAAIILKNAAHVLSAYAHNPSWNHPDIIEEQYRSLEALDKHRPETPKMNELCYKHPKLLRAKGVSRRVLAKLYSAPGESFSVLELAGSRHGGARGRAKAACLALEKVGLAKRDGDRWTLGDAARF
jgi:hypothetical protein